MGLSCCYTASAGLKEPGETELRTNYKERDKDDHNYYCVASSGDDLSRPCKEGLTVVISRQLLKKRGKNYGKGNKEVCLRGTGRLFP